MLRPLAILLVAMVLLLACAAPAVAQTTPVQVPAIVQVAAYINITISDRDPAGLNFGNHNPSDQDTLDIDSVYDTQAPIQIVVKKETNSTVNLQMRGTDFTSGGNTLPIGNATWNTTNNPGASTPITDTFATMATVSPSASDIPINVYHWLDIPASQRAGSYSATFYYQGSAQ
ncbi:MAG: hypothetical protein ACYC4L_12230 [Chloroflexota bacterium]